MNYELGSSPQCRFSATCFNPITPRSSASGSTSPRRNRTVWTLHLAVGADAHLFDPKVR